MPSYFTLEFGVGYLKNFTNDEANAVPNEGNQRTFTAEDLLESEATAFHEINSTLIAIYDVSTWTGSVPVIIAQIAEMLGAGFMWLKKYNSDAGFGDANSVTVLTQGRLLLSDLRSGKMSIIKSDGSVQTRRMLQETYELA